MVLEVSNSCRHRTRFTPVGLPYGQIFYPSSLSPIPAEGAGGIIYPAIAWKCFSKYVEPISFDLVSLKVFVWSLTVFMHFMSCIKTVIGLTEKDKGVIRPVKPFKSCVLIMIIILPIRFSFG